MKRSPFALFFSSVLPASCALLLLAGCASRPPRTVGPPQTPVMPPPRSGSEAELPAPIELEFETVEMEPLPPPPRMEPAPVSRPKPAPRKGTPYTLKKGESLSVVAARNSMSWVKLAEYNRITEPNKVQVGQVILIPPSAESASATYRPAPPPPSANRGNTYVVQSGDNLTSVARKYNTTWKELKSLNNLRSDRLLVGQILKVPAGSPSAPAPTVRSTTPAPVAPRAQPTPTPTPVAELPEMDAEPMTESEPTAAEDPLVEKPFTIIVMEGDTLETIAANYVVSVEKIRSLNNLAPDATLTPGQELEMPPGLY